MTMKLDYNNYLVWRHQIEVILEAYSLISFIEDSNGAPDPFMKDSLGIIPLKQILNMFTRRIVNKHCLRLSILTLTVGQKSGKGVWKILEKCFASISCSHVLGLRDELMSLKKGTKTIDSFFQRIKEICDKLSAIVVCVDEEELIHLALKGTSS